MFVFWHLFYLNVYLLFEFKRKHSGVLAKLPHIKHIPQVCSVSDRDVIYSIVGTLAIFHTLRYHGK